MAVLIDITIIFIIVVASVRENEEHPVDPHRNILNYSKKYSILKYLIIYSFIIFH